MLRAGTGEWSGQLGQRWKILASGQCFFCNGYKQPYAHTCLCGCWFWLVYCSLPITSQHLPVAGVETAEQLQSGCCRAQQPRFGLYHVSGAQKPQTKGMSELQSVGKIFWKQGGTRLSSSRAAAIQRVAFASLSREGPTCLSTSKSRDTLPLSPSKGEDSLK